MRPFCKLLDGGLETLVSQLSSQLAANPHLWGERQDRAYGDSPHNQMQDIWVRYNHPANLTERSTFNSEHDSIWYPAAKLLPAAQEIAFKLMAAVQGERLGGVLLTKLPSGGMIAPHVDTGWHAGYYDKFYVPVQNDPGCIFGFDAGNMLAVPGEAWWFRNDVPHWVTNDSERDRISMIVCIKMRTDPIVV